MPKTRNLTQDPSLAEIFGTEAVAYQRGIDRIVEQAHEVAARDKWPLKKHVASVAGPGRKGKRATR